MRWDSRRTELPKTLYIEYWALSCIDLPAGSHKGTSVDVCRDYLGTGSLETLYE